MSAILNWIVGIATIILTIPVLMFLLAEYILAVSSWGRELKQRMRQEDEDHEEEEEDTKK